MIHGPGGSTGESLTSAEETSGSTYEQDAFRQTPMSKPYQTGRRRRWKERKVQEEQKRALTSRVTDVETPKTLQERPIVSRLTDVERPKTVLERRWYDDNDLSPLFESPADGEDEPSELYGTWRHDEGGG